MKFHRALRSWFFYRSPRSIMAILGFILVGCQRSPAVYPTVEGPLSMGEGLRIGVLTSSNRSRLSRQFRSSIDAAYVLRDYVNRCGGVNQAPVSLVVADARGTVRSEEEAMQELVEQYRVHGAIAKLISSDPYASLNVAVDAQMPVLVSTFGGRSFTDSSSLRPALGSSTGYLGHITPSNQQYIDALAETIWVRGYTRVALLTSDEYDVDHWTINPDWIEAFTQTYEALGGTVVNSDRPLAWEDLPSESPPPDSGDSAPLPAPEEQEDASTRPQDELSGWIAEEQTTVLALFDLYDGIDFMRDLATLEVGEEPLPIFWADFNSLRIGLNQYSPSRGESLRVFSGMGGVTPTTVGNGFQSFRGTWHEVFTDSPDAQAAYIWDSVALLILAAQAAGNNGGASIAAKVEAIATPPGTLVVDVCDGLERLRAGEDINYDGASGAVDLTPAGDASHFFDVWRVNDEGELVVVDRVSPTDQVGAAQHRPK